MPKNEKITVPQFTILVTLYTIGTSILIAPNIVTFFAQQDGWISNIINLMIGFVLVFFYNKIAKAFQGRSIFHYMEDTIGSWPAKIVSFLFFSYYFLLIALLIREIGDFATINLYPDTPLEVIMGLFIVIMIIGARYGLETLARGAEIMFPWFLFLLTILLITLIPEMKTENIFPIFAKGMKPVLLASYGSIGTPFLQLFLFLILIPYVNAPEKTGKAFIVGVLIGGMVIFFITLASILVLGSEPMERLYFPSYTMAKTISIANIIERIESFLAAIWFISVYMKISLTFYCSILFLKHTFNLKQSNSLIFPLGLILVFLSVYISPNIIHYKNFVGRSWTAYSILYAIILPFLLLGIHWLKNRTKEKQQNG